MKRKNCMTKIAIFGGLTLVIVFVVYFVFLVWSYNIIYSFLYTFIFRKKTNSEKYEKSQCRAKLVTFYHALEAIS